MLKKTHTITWLTGQKTESCHASDLTPMKAIRRKCLDCSNGSAKEVKECAITTCPLYPFRLGKRPQYEGTKKPTRSLSAEHLKKLRQARTERYDNNAAAIGI